MTHTERSKWKASLPAGTPARGVVNLAILCVVVTLPLLWALVFLRTFSLSTVGFEPFTDAMTYLAAGERLNAGHDLYRLVPGDRRVLSLPGLYTSPFLSPPPIAVLWRPIAAVEWGVSLWVIACWAALLGTMVYLVLRAGPWAAVLALVLCRAIGEQLAVANVNAFMPLVYVLTWQYRERAWIGGLIAAAASIKLAPAAMSGWLIGTRRWKALAAMVIVGLLLFAIGGLGAGFRSYVDYLGTLGGNAPSGLSLSGLTGISFASYVPLVGGTLVAIAIGPRYPTASWVVALLASVLGTPALYGSGLVSLLALAAPLIGTGREMRFRLPGGSPVSDSPTTDLIEPASTHR